MAYEDINKKAINTAHIQVTTSFPKCLITQDELQYAINIYLMYLEREKAVN